MACLALSVVARPIELNTRAAAIIQSLKFKLGDLPVFAGPVQRYINAAIKPGNLGDLAGDILPPDLQERWQALVRSLLTQDVVISALGIAVELDTRDNFFGPHAGYYYQLERVCGSKRSSPAATELSDLDAAPSRVAKGGGFRYLIASRYGFEMGMDIARGPEDTVFYIQAGTAWR